MKKTSSLASRKGLKRGPGTVSFKEDGTVYTERIDKTNTDVVTVDGNSERNLVDHLLTNINALGSYTTNGEDGEKRPGSVSFKDDGPIYTDSINRTRTDVNIVDENCESESTSLSSNDHLLTKLEALASKIGHLENQNKNLATLVPEIEHLKKENQNLSSKLTLIESEEMNFMSSDDDPEGAPVRKDIISRILSHVDEAISERLDNDPQLSGSLGSHIGGSSSLLNGDLMRISRHENTPWRSVHVNPLEEERRKEERENKRNKLKRASTMRRIKDQEESKELYLQRDAFSFFVCYKWNSIPFAFAFVVVFGLQLSLVVLLLEDQLALKNSENPMQIPVNIDFQVRFAQILSLLIAVFSQDDIRGGVEGIVQGLPTRFKGSRDFYQLNTFQWYIGYFIRFVVGASTLVGTFVLIVRSDNVFDLFLNFSGIEFISALDDVVFHLSLRGYAGKEIESAANKIVDARFDLHGKGKRWYSLTKKTRHILGLVSILVIVFTGYGFLLSQQLSGSFLETRIRVEFGDTVIPFLGVFNGCYIKLDSGFDQNERVTYAHQDFYGIEEECGKFGFCDNDEFQGWTFYTGNDPCDFTIATTSETSSYDLLDASKSDWYTTEGQPLDYIRLLQLADENVPCGYVTENNADLCSSLTIDEGLDGFDNGRIWNKNFEDLVDANGETIEFTGHPVFVGELEEAEGFEIIFFTGRRWILATAQSLFASFRSDRDPASIIMTDVISLLQDPEFNVLYQKAGTFDFISEAVDDSDDDGTPLGIQWYNTRYVDSDPNSVTFPFADISRPSNAVLRCGECDDILNPCLYDGVCVKGICNCQHETSGKLCDVKPLGDGVCQDRFNMLEYGYDGGDCCGGTCEGSFCGLSGPATPFGFDVDDPLVSSIRGGYRGFANCQNPDMATLRIQLVIDREPDSFCDLDSLTVQCDGTTYLQTPFLRFGDRFDNSNNCLKSYTETIYVPFGTVCGLSRKRLNDNSPSSGYRTVIYYDDNIKPLDTGDENQTLVSWFVPQMCLTNFFEEYSELALNDGSAESDIIEAFTIDGISDALCTKDRDLIKERYALTHFNNSVALASSDWNLHQCYGWGSPCVKIICKKEKVLLLDLDDTSTTKQGTIPTQISFLSSLKVLRLSSPDFTGVLPTAIGMLSTLTNLHLKSNGLEGTIPANLGDLINLELLSLRDNNFSGTIPTELFQLTNLKSLSLGENSLNGSIPTEIGNLEDLEVLLIQDNAFTGRLPSDIARLSNLRSCYVGGNNFSKESWEGGDVLSNKSWLPGNCISN